MMNTSLTYIIEDNFLMRCGLISFLDHSSFKIQKDIVHVDDVIKNGDHAKIVLLSANESSEKTIQDIELLKHNMPEAHIVVLCEELNQSILGAYFSSEADGLLMKNISPEALLASLELIMTGEKVFPTLMASIITKSWHNRKPQDAVTIENNTQFSQRAFDIIRSLSCGDSNKLIARNLGISESTVKVHLKTILKKLKLSNRTQVALWAVHNGIEPRQYSDPSLLPTQLKLINMEAA